MRLWQLAVDLGYDPDKDPERYERFCEGSKKTRRNLHLWAMRVYLHLGDYTGKSYIFFATLNGKKTERYGQTLVEKGLAQDVNIMQLH